MAAGFVNLTGLDVSAPTTRVIKQHKMMAKAILASVVRISHSQPDYELSR
jgi:hypothetical protein